ncbi:MAG: hypothetical protein J7641_22990 [Cyanobacteria bacterium SID2]|nr:hypothetical protein [Cyanobacteria bacterium SID2]MBP0003955.1 hypothetical protein [Cyanobacteria bacterium SBC]
MTNPELYVNPPAYGVVIVSCLFAVLCGIIFKDILEYQFSRWNDRGQPSELNYKTPHLRAAYILTCSFTTVCVGSSLSVFGIADILAYLIGTIVVAPTGLLIWLQLGSMMSLVEKEGLQAIRIDE